jgi:hypothetical protein
MLVTLEVSKISSWSKASAPCRVQRGHLTEGNVYTAQKNGTEGRANQQHTRGVRVAQLGSVGTTRRRKRTQNM